YCTITSKIPINKFCTPSYIHPVSSCKIDRHAYNAAQNVLTRIFRLVTEGQRAYKPQGLPPVSIGDVFDNGRFKVLRKLGYGGSGTVWLCKDNQKGNYVALRVLPASITGVFEKSAVNEISLQQQLWSQGTTVQDEGENHIVKFLGEFRHVSPNGTHLCLLLEAMGPNLTDMAIRRPWESGSLPEGGSITG